MDFRHRVALIAPPDRVARFAASPLCISQRDSVHGQLYIILDVLESDPRWSELVDLITEFRGGDMQSTDFTADEIRNAKWLMMTPIWHHGYPMPDDGSFRDLTYDTSHYCHTCGIGSIQKAPFRFRAEPRWGRRHILQLNWVFDEYFVKPDVWEETFKPFGIDCQPVWRNKRGDFCETAVQLKIDHIADSPIQFRGHPFEVCQDCGRKRYEFFVRGMLPALERFPEPHIFKTMEYFGSGHLAYRKVIVSHELQHAIEARGLRGVEFAPLES